MTTIGEAISRIRGQIKAESQDAFMTDRYIYSLILKYAQLFMRRQDSTNKLMKFNSVWQSLNFLELEEIDKVEAVCTGIQSGSTIKKTKYKLPTFMEGYWGPLIRSVTSIDGSIKLQPTDPATYASISRAPSFKYNSTRYFWYLNEHLYLPNIDWDGIKLEGVFEGDISTWTCDTEDDCQPMYLKTFYIPEFLFSEIESQILNVAFNTMKIPGEDSDNKQNPNR